MAIICVGDEKFQLVYFVKNKINFMTHFLDQNTAKL